MRCPLDAFAFVMGTAKKIHIPGIGTRTQDTTYTMLSNRQGAGGTITMAMFLIQLGRTLRERFMGRIGSTTKWEEPAEIAGTVSRGPKFSSFLATNLACKVSILSSLY